MKKLKKKTVTELRNSLFETFDQVVDGSVQIVTHKSGHEIAMVPADMIEKLQEKLEDQKNLMVGYGQAMRGEGLSTEELRKELKKEVEHLRKIYD